MSSKESNSPKKTSCIKTSTINPLKIAEAILQGNRAALSRAITYIESTKPEHTLISNEILEHCLPYANNSIRIAITGVPGVGKSSFIEVLGSQVASKENEVAVLAIDPSSNITKGSILGDKTRMEQLSINPHVFIRPSPTGNNLGGVARKTRETIILCEACGFKTILIETVGVGQSETTVSHMVDFFLLLKLAGAGDALQGIKRGIMEFADAIVIHKADGHNSTEAKKAKVAFEKAMHYMTKKNGQITNVCLASSIEQKGIDNVWLVICNFIRDAKNSGAFQEKRKQQNMFWLYKTIEQHLTDSLYSNVIIQEALKKQLTAINNQEITPFTAAKVLTDLIKLDITRKS